MRNKAGNVIRELFAKRAQVDIVGSQVYIPIERSSTRLLDDRPDSTTELAASEVPGCVGGISKLSISCSIFGADSRQDSDSTH
jgi:hypothetical protein